LDFSIFQYFEHREGGGGGTTQLSTPHLFQLSLFRSVGIRLFYIFFFFQGVFISTYDKIPVEEYKAFIRQQLMKGQMDGCLN